ncbi:uroporphyrinogen-III C-methyltransferase [Microbacterium sp. H1-D42]|uniref:uroporphyrinogen-III C-methyltransferase n=1 Tax=Microbacterium sp. H1-D42 TaxID=2925844 RepID=UPI001F539DA1|nr:uroporphyrinogen-III C-methyltransferase [Microbacterium sp. H1-D42]UNK71057.1 uroporphyrinogen-III C-methyltransferase [Microbacterium sp. H1-D42]
MTGTLTLVGAGPGDAGLLTLRGLRALQDADVIVADRLGARAVLDQLTAEGVLLTADVIDVGKHPGHHPVPQSEINDLLVRHVREGKNVVRLKGGDPFVLGRGREEQLHAEAAGITASVVSGVTSAVSVPALAGIPLTHRGVAVAFTVVSAHDPLDALPGGSDHTIVLLMGVGTLAHAAGVLAGGERGRGCPVAIVEDGFGPGQRVTIGTLDTIAALAAARRVRNPAVIVVGDVVRLSPDADAALTRPAEDSAASSIFTRWVDALDAGLAVDSGAIVTVPADPAADLVSSRKARS